MKNNYAYVTLLSSWDYLLAVLVLNKSLIKHQSKYPLVVGVTEDIYDIVSFYLEKENILFKMIPQLEYSDGSKKAWGEDNSVLKTASKIALFSFNEFDKLIYIDADSLLRKNIDELFDYPDGSILVSPTSGIMSGLIVFCPRNHNFQAYYTLLQIFDWLDGDLFAEMFFPAKSNLDYQISDKYSKLIVNDMDNIDDVYCAQFVYLYKPWKYLKLEYLINDFSKKIEVNECRRQIFEEYFDILKIYQVKYPELLRGFQNEYS